MAIKSSENKLIGTWDISVYFSPSDVVKMSDEPLPNGLSIEMTMSGSQTYHVGGKYSGKGEFTLRIKKNDKKIPLRFLIREAGTWEIHDDILVETTGDSVVTPLDELTRNVVSQSPQLQNMLSPISGEATSIRIKNISDSIAELEILGPPNISVTLKKS